MSTDEKELVLVKENVALGVRKNSNVGDIAVPPERLQGPYGHARDRD